MSESKPVADCMAAKIYQTTSGMEVEHKKRKIKGNPLCSSMKMCTVFGKAPTNNSKFSLHKKQR